MRFSLVGDSGSLVLVFLVQALPSFKLHSPTLSCTTSQLNDNLKHTVSHLVRVQLSTVIVTVCGVSSLLKLGT